MYLPPSAVNDCAGPEKQRKIRADLLQNSKSLRDKTSEKLRIIK
jgi:hypothetical protein